MHSIAPCLHSTSVALLIGGSTLSTSIVNPLTVVTLHMLAKHLAAAYLRTAKRAWSAFATNVMSSKTNVCKSTWKDGTRARRVDMASTTSWPCVVSGSEIASGRSLLKQRWMGSSIRVRSMGTLLKSSLPNLTQSCSRAAFGNEASYYHGPESHSVRPTFIGLSISKELRGLGL